jgi:DNA end-binding protein Ku
MPRPIWTGAISFGLVNVPVKLYTATQAKDVRFHQLHDKDGVRLQQKRVCPKDGEEVPYEHVVKGYEIAPGQYVTVTQDELRALSPKSTKTIEIEEFVDLAEIDPVYYEHSYYLAPDRNAARPYALLLRAMQESNRVAIGRVVLRTKEYLTAIRPMGRALTMSTMLFADEVVDQDRIEGLPDDEVETPARELKMARQLVESLTTEFEPDRFRDEYRAKVLDLIDRKAAGQEIAEQPEEEEAAPVTDLMAALEASLADAKQKAGAGQKASSPRGSNGSKDGSKPRTKSKGKTAAKS